MTIENQGEMAINSIKRIFSAPRGKGEAMPAAGASSSSLHDPSLRPPGSALNPRNKAFSPLTVRTGRLDRTTLRGSSIVAPPSHHIYSRDVPFSPWHPTIHHNLITNKRITVPTSGRRLSSHIVVTVNVYNSPLHNCARSDSWTIREIPETTSHPSTGNPPVCPDAGIDRILGCRSSLKGTVQ